MTLEGLGLAREWPRDQLMLDLRRGDYQAAAQRIEHESAPDKELESLVRRAASLRKPELAELERMARGALSSGDIVAFGEWLDLGWLRGDADMTQVREVLSALKLKPLPEVPDLLAQTPETWRDALEPLLRASAH